MSGRAPAAAPGLTTAEQGTVDAVDAAAMAADLDVFAGLGLRLAGTDAERDGARYVHDRMTAAGIDCRLEAFDGWVSYADEPARFGPATVTLPDGAVLQGKIYAFGGSTPDGGVTAPLVWANAGTPDDHADLDVTGCIVLSVLSMDAPHGEPVRLAGERGAVGIVIVNWDAGRGDVIHTGTARGAWGNPTPQDLQTERRIPVVAVSHGDGMVLRELARAGASVRLDVRTHARWERSLQPIAEIPGTTDDFVLVFCHLDTFGAGMTDNTTGVVGLMELARRLHAEGGTRRRGIRLAWWAGHEMPYNGSTHHLDAHWDELRDHCVAVINADSWAIADTVDRVLTWGFAEAEAFATACADDVLQRETGFEDFQAREAEQSFWALGVPSWMAFSIAEGYPDGLSYLGGYWHSEQDVLAHVDQDALRQLVAVYAVTCRRLCATEVLPFRYGALGLRLRSLLEALAARHPGIVAWDGLLAAVQDFQESARAADAALDAGVAVDADVHLKAVARLLNPVIYTVGGAYAQDPSSASHLSRRLPGLQQALDGVAAGGELAPAWSTSAMRERNRATDALLVAARELRALVGG